MFTEQQNLAITRTELDTVFYQQFAYDATNPGIATANTGMIFKPITIDRGAYIGEINMGPGLFSVVGETQTVPITTPAVRNKYTIVVKDFANAMPISKDLFDDNMHGVWAEDVKQFALMARVTMDLYAFEIFRGAFTTTLTADGSAFIGTHTLIGGGTTSNLISGALSRTTLETATIALRQQVNQRGVVLGGVPTILLVPPALWITAIQITESALITNSADNNINVFRSAYGITVYQSPYLGTAVTAATGITAGSNTAWYLMTANHCVSRLIRQGVETALTPWQYSTNRTYNYQANFRESYFVPDYSGTVGATGL